MLNFSIIASLATASNYTSHYTSYTPSNKQSNATQQPLNVQNASLKNAAPSEK